MTWMASKHLRGPRPQIKIPLGPPRTPWFITSLHLSLRVLLSSTCGRIYACVLRVYAESLAFPECFIFIFFVLTRIGLTFVVIAERENCLRRKSRKVRYSARSRELFYRPPHYATLRLTGNWGHESSLAKPETRPTSGPANVWQNISSKHRERE